LYVHALRNVVPEEDREGGRGGRDEGGKEGRGRREEQRGDEGGHKQWGLKKTSKHNSSEIQLSKF
jgi:hypothetical protein